MKKGFTLIELLAVIVILAIIALIAVPIIINIISDAKKQSSQRSAELYIDAAELAIARKNLTTELGDTTCEVQSDGNLMCNGTIPVQVDVDGEKPTRGTLIFSNGKVIDGSNLTFKDDSTYNVQSGYLVLGEPLEPTDEACFQFTTERVTSYDINYNVCVVVAEQMSSSMSLGWTNDQISTICNDGKVGMFSMAGFLTVPEYKTMLENYGAITNVETEEMNGVSIVGYTCGDKDVVIPSKINNKPVVDIAWNVFNSKDLTSVVIPNSVTTIEGSAFRDNQLSGSLTIPDSVTTIGDSAFYHNQLTSVTIGNSVTTIGEDAFQCNQLTSLTLGNSVETINRQAFYENRLKNVTIPDSVKTIYPYAFAYNSIETVKIGSGIESIGHGAFGNPGTGINTYDGTTYGPNQITSVKIARGEYDIELGDYVFCGPQGCVDSYIQWNTN